MTVMVVESMTHLDHLDLAARPTAFRITEQLKVRSDLNIGQVARDFKDQFDNQIEQPARARTLHCYRLNQPASDEDIVTRLGGPTKIAVDLQTLFELIKAQKDGQQGMLAVEFGVSNLLYVLNAKRQLTSVYCSWLPGSWGIGCIDYNTVDRRVGQHILTYAPRILAARA